MDFGYPTALWLLLPVAAWLLLGRVRRREVDPPDPALIREVAAIYYSRGFAIEPMVLAGTAETRVLPDKWTVVSADGSLTAHFEHSVAVTEGEPLILTVP